MNPTPAPFPPPETALADLARTLPDLPATLRRHDDGTPFLHIDNPNGGSSLRIDLDDSPALHFGPHHDHYDPTLDGWLALLAAARKIVDGTLLACTFSDADASWPVHFFLDLSVDPLCTDVDAFRVLVDTQWNPMAGELLARSARVGAVLSALAWNPAGNRRFALDPDWFQTLVRPTGLDYLLAAAEVQTTPGGSLLEAFAFDAGDATYECRRDASRWLLRPAPWTCPSRRQCRPLASAPTLDALLDLPLPPPAASTVRDALAAQPAWNVFITRTRGDDDTPWTLQTPLDPIGLCGLFDDWVQCPSHYLSVTLRPDEAASVRPFFNQLDGHFGTHFDSADVLPSRFAAPALALLHTWQARLRRPAVRAAAAKLLPVFESAATRRMPISYHF
jgi:hypothetical protein